MRSFVWDGPPPRSRSRPALSEADSIRLSSSTVLSAPRGACGVRSTHGRAADAPGPCIELSACWERLIDSDSAPGLLGAAPAGRSRKGATPERVGAYLSFNPARPPVEILLNHLTHAYTPQPNRPPKPITATTGSPDGAVVHPRPGPRLPVGACASPSGAQAGRSIEAGDTGSRRARRGGERAEGGRRTTPLGSHGGARVPADRWPAHAGGH